MDHHGVAAEARPARPSALLVEGRCSVPGDLDCKGVRT